MFNFAMDRNMIRSDLCNYKVASNLGLNEKIVQRIENGEKIYHMAFGQSPFPIYEPAVKALQNYAHENAYLPVAGIKELRQAIIQFHERSDGIHGISSDDVIVSTGTKQLSFLLFSVFGGDVYLPSPTWTTYRPQTVLAHHQPIVINTMVENGWKIDAAELDNMFENNKESKKLLVLINPDNPTGTSYTAEDNKAIAKVCKKHNAIVLSDEIYSLLNFNEDHDSIYKHYPEGTILQNGLSKWASAGGWRIGYHIYPPSLSNIKAAVRSAGSHTYSCASAPIQYAALEYFKFDAECAEYVAHCRRILKALSQYIHKELTEIGIKVLPPKGGFYMMPDFEILRVALKKKGITNADEMSKLLLEDAKVSLLACGPAFLRPKSEFTFRLCFINFDGKKALDESRKIGLKTPITDEFLKANCTKTIEGIQKLKSWTLDQLSDQ